MSLAKSEAKILHDNISDRAYTHEDLIRIISTRSKAQLAATFNQYIDLFENPILKVRPCRIPLPPPPPTPSLINCGPTLI